MYKLCPRGEGGSINIVLIDNYDSFTYNIVEYLKELNCDVRVFKNDEVTVEELKKIDFSHLVISPGPGNPQDDSCGICEEAIKTFYKEKRILGVCLGHQLIARYFGAKIAKDPNPFHGKVSKIFIKHPSDLFKNIPNEFTATRYHSLKIDNLSLTDEIVTLAQTQDGIVMAIKIKDFNIYGVQYHPEAILTEYGHQIFRNFISL